jgi:hypothetical protein
MVILTDVALEVKVLAFGRQHDLVKMSFVAAPRLTSAQLSSVLLAEPQRPLADRIVSHGDTPAGDQLLDVARA